ncbi:MAG: hypothetical protein EHM93_14360 [Bacteroidales bacterium]|nr:MAG: hypothetical protein EHM93_14360 [Bacteroidales bacterium]
MLRIIKNNYRYLLILLLFADITFSFIQHFHLPLEGDMACIIVPSDGYKQLMSDPLGLSALKGDIYPGTNRFFAHWTMATYYKITPFICQWVINPIDSIYLSNTIAKTGIQILIILLLSFYITRTWKVFSKDFLISAALITPLFQTFGFNAYIGIIDKSITYTFFYALPLTFLMIFFIPFYYASSQNRNINLNKWVITLLIPFIIFLSLNGPLIPAVVLIVCPLILLFRFRNNYLISNQRNRWRRIIESINGIDRIEIGFFVLFTLTSLYSIYVGRFNAENFNNIVPLVERYKLLINGIYIQFTHSAGSILLVLAIVINTTVIWFQKPTAETKRISKTLQWIIVLSLIYTILLPLGGYRAYRPYIIRWDSYMPVNLCLFYYYGLTSLYLINNIKPKLKLAYITGIAMFLLVFTIADKTNYYSSTCEKESLKVIANSPEKLVLINSDCSIMAWGKTTNPDDSKFNTQYLQYIGVLKDEKLYYQK